MEPQIRQEDERDISDTMITPLNVKTSKLSKDYKEIIKLLMKYSSTYSTVKLLSTCIESQVKVK